jgi:HK97 gp10 family phage protein
MDIKQIVNKYLDIVGRQIVEDAQDNCPVKTGALRSSIKYTVGNESVDIGSDLFYAKFIELGTSKIAPRAFLRLALRNRHNYS